MKIAHDNKEFCAAILIDLSKTFDGVCHDLLIAKPIAYGFDRNALKPIYDYLSDRSQKIKVGFRLVPIQTLFMLCHRDLYLGLCCLADLFVCFLRTIYSSGFANFANDTTPYESSPTLNQVMSNLEITTEKMFEWFSFNNLKAYASKFHLFISLYQPVPVKSKFPSLKAATVRNC